MWIFFTIMSCEGYKVGKNKKLPCDQLNHVLMFCNVIPYIINQPTFLHLFILSALMLPFNYLYYFDVVVINCTYISRF